MIELKYDVFKMQMVSLAALLHNSIEISVLKNEYWPYCNKRDSRWFADAVQWLKENYEYKRFPLISDFKKAFTCTRSTKYVPEGPKRVIEHIDPIEYKKDFQKLVEKFTPKEENRDGEAVVKNRQLNLYRRMKKENKAWSYKRKKWVDRTLMNNIGGEFLLPEERL